MSIDLSFAQRQIEALMDDTCRIEYDAGTADDAFDEASGKHVPADPDISEIYEGKCKITAAGGTQHIEEGGAHPATTAYRGSIPVDAPPVPLGALLTVLTSLRDPQLVGRQFRVRGVVASTMLVQRRLQLELRQP